MQVLHKLHYITSICSTATARTSKRADFLRALPTYQEAAELIEIHPSGITRAVAKLGIQPELWGGTEKHLRALDVLEIAAQARRASVEEVAGGLLERIAHDHAQREAIRAEIDSYLAAREPAQPTPQEAFLAELHDALPRQYAKQAERIYRRHVRGS